MNFIQPSQLFSITNREYEIVKYENKRNKVQGAEDAKRNGIKCSIVFRIYLFKSRSNFDPSHCFIVSGKKLWLLHREREREREMRISILGHLKYKV